MMTKTVTRKDVSHALAELMPQIIRGVQLDFFVAKGITQTQFLMLTAVRAYSRCPMSTLARNLHVSLPTATGVVDRLVKAGFLRRGHAEDRRQVIIDLTPKGRTFFQEFEQVLRRRWEEVLAALEPEELAAFYDVITKLRTHILQEAS